MSTSSSKLANDWLVGAAVLVSAFGLLATDRVEARQKEDRSGICAYLFGARTGETGDGSIFQVDYGYAPLTSGPRAAQVGDMLTIVLAERTQASKSNAAKDRSHRQCQLDSAGDWPGQLLRPHRCVRERQQRLRRQGRGHASNQLNGEITVTIAEVYPNGTMLVRGEKMLRLNRGDENIRISGIVRDADIGADNRVSSTRVANAKITYTGKGEIARASRQGWLQRFFTMLSPSRICSCAHFWSFSPPS